MALSGQQWLEQVLYPKVEGLAETPKSDDPRIRSVRVRMVSEIFAALEALTMTGVLTREQDEQAQSRLAEIGIRQERRLVTSWGASAGIALTTSGVGGAQPEATTPAAPHLLRRVVPMPGEVVGADGDVATITAVELWTDEVVACVVVEPGPDLLGRQQADRDALREWHERRRFGDAEDRPPLRHSETSFARAQWALTLGVDRVVASSRTGSGSGGWWRMTVGWSVVLTDETELTIEVGGQTITVTLT